MSPEFKANCTITHCQSTNVSLANDSLASTVEEIKLPPAEILKLILEVLIALFGVIGNVFVLAFVSRLGKKKHSSDFYLQNLAVADLGILLLSLPLLAVREKDPNNWPFGEFVCHYLYPIPEIFYGGSVWFIAVIAIERYRNVVKIKATTKKHIKTALQRAKIVANCVWITSFLIFSLPVYFFFEYRELQNDKKWCGAVWPSWDRKLVMPRLYVGLLTLFSYILPLAIISFTYLRISYVLNRSSLFIKAMIREEHGKTGDERNIITNVLSVRLRQNKRAKRIITPLVVVFAVTMLPLSIFRLTAVIWPLINTQDYYGNLLYVVSVFVVVNSSADPLIYSVVSRDFRKGINNLCLQRCFSVSVMLRSRFFRQNPGH